MDPGLVWTLSNSDEKVCEIAIGIIYGDIAKVGKEMDWLLLCVRKFTCTFLSFEKKEMARRRIRQEKERVMSVI